MVTVLFKTESHYTVDRTRVKETIERILHDRGVTGKIEISVSIVGDRFMRQLNNKYRRLDETTTVLAFPMQEINKEVPFVDPPDNVLRLGDIVISYPQARERASEDNRMVDDEVDLLIEHGMGHLLGNNQEEK